MDELQEIRQNLFGRITLWLGWGSVIAGVIAGVADGLASAWLLRASAWLLIVLVAYLLRRFGHPMMAAYFLILNLIGLVAELLVEMALPAEIVCYLFIPIIIIASLILSPRVTSLLGLLVLLIAITLSILTGQLTLSHYTSFLPSFGLLLLIPVLVVWGGYERDKLGKRLVESNHILRKRTLEMLKTQERVDQLQQKIVGLEKQLAEAKTETSQIRHLTEEVTQNLTRLAKTKPAEKPPAIIPSSPKPGPIQTNFGPVARFGPRYITRFGIILLVLLLAVTGLTLLLAIVNRPIESNQPPAAQAMLTTQLQPTATATIEAGLSLTPIRRASTTPTLIPTSTQPAPAAPTPLVATTVIAQVKSPQPLKTMLPLPETPLAVQPTNTPTSTPQAKATPLSLPTVQSNRPQGQTPTPTATLSPSPEPRATPPPTRAASLPTPVTLPTLASPSPDLTFVTNLNLNPAIKAVEAGSSRVAVSLGEAANSRLSWQNGQALFSSKVSGDPEIYLASSDRPQPTNLTLMAGDDLQPAWSPDGRRLAFSSGRKGNLDIYVMECVNPPARCGGGKVTQLTTSRGFEEWPAWSPDGRRLAFVSDRDGNVEIYVMDTDGQNQQRLTQNPADDWPAAWSPDGRWIVFASQRDGNWNLYVMNSTGQQVQRLTNDPADEREPVWSPDGRTIAFGYNGNGNWDIYTVPAPGATPGELPRNAWTQVTATSTDERYPAWLPR